jgi:hypothetical protein
MTINSGRITGNSDVTRLGTAQSFVRHFRVTSAHTIFVFGASDQLLRFRELGSGEVKAQPLLKLLANFRRQNHLLELLLPPCSASGAALTLSESLFVGMARKACASPVLVSTASPVGSPRELMENAWESLLE